MKPWLKLTTYLTWSLVVGLFLSPLAEGKSGASRIYDVAILGDSLSTGAGSHPALEFDSQSLWKVFTNETSIAPQISDIPEPERFGLEDDFSPPVRLWPSRREFRGGFDWVFRNLMSALSQRYLNTEEYSWGYLVGRALGVPSSKILIAAQDGARTMAIPRQIDRVLSATGGVYPAKIFLFFTGNDLCGPTLSMVTRKDDYGEQLKSGLEYLYRNGRPAAGGTEIHLVGFLGILQLLHADTILDQPVRAFGEMTTCRELRKKNYTPEEPKLNPDLPPEAWYFSMVMPPNPSAYCPTLFGRGIGGSKENIGDLANRIRDFREIQKNMPKQFADRGDSGFRLHYVETTTKLVFSGKDVAGDCFHLNAHGQSRVAATVLSGLSPTH
jgi:hypothetical protein